MQGSKHQPDSCRSGVTMTLNMRRLFAVSAFAGLLLLLSPAATIQASPPLPCSSTDGEICTLPQPLMSDATASVRIACLNRGHFFYRVRPVDCDFFARFVTGRGERVRDIRTRSLVWSNWGRRLARAVGESSGGHFLVVLAYHRVSCGGGRSDYEFARIRRPPSDRSFRMKLATCGAQRL